ncbi:MAG: ATP-binding protein [Victivallaceae bacterium]|nr:ATP-binding protein [Victivallaceae bacterium]
MNYIKRAIESQIKESMFKGKAIILFGARQVGKTTLIEHLLEEEITAGNVLMLNGDEADIRQLFTNYNEVKLKRIVTDKRIIYIDEAQRISDIGLIIKIFTDKIKDVQVIASGSSALELANGIQEPLTGRKYEFNLYPISFNELVHFHSELTEQRHLEMRLIYGSYPEIVTDSDQAKRHLKLLSNSYLYKDIFILENIKKPVYFDKLLQALALQVGSEVKYSELASLVGINKNTVERYINLLEKAFIIFPLHALSRNPRNEIKKGRKIYFYDCGIRNAVIGNFTRIEQRNDVGALWENYIIAERMKLLHKYDKKTYFWRTVQQQELDYIEEDNNSFSAYEIKWNRKKQVKLSKTFSRNYQTKSFTVINPDNYADFLLQ